MAYGGWIEPSLLLCLRDAGSRRCHELAGMLVGLGFGNVKLKRLYPVLQRMEEKGLVISGDGYVDRPTWRRYEITASGEQHLERWARAFERYRSEMDHFLWLYDEPAVRRKSRV